MVFALSTDKIEKSDDGHDLVESRRTICPHCNHEVTPNIEGRHTVASIVLFIILFCLLSVIGICVFFLLGSAVQDRLHICPHCKKTIYRQKRFHWPVVANEIITLRFGSCAVILSKQYVYVFGLILLFVASGSLIRWYLRTVGLPDIPEGEPTSLTWSDFQSRCGLRSSLGNPFRANLLFKQDFYGKTVSWEGRLNKVEEGFFQKHFLFVNMNPHQTSRPELADIALMFNAHKLSEKVASLERGDKFSWKGTILEVGKRGSPHLGVLWDLNLTARAAELPEMFEESQSSFYARPPISHLPRVARKIKQVRNEFIRQQAEKPWAYMIGDELVGVMPLQQQQGQQQAQKKQPIPSGVGVPKPVNVVASAAP